MNFQEIIVLILLAFALIYLVNFFIKQSKAHNCDDCSLMDMKKESEVKKQK